MGGENLLCVICCLSYKPAPGVKKLEDENGGDGIVETVSKFCEEILGELKKPPPTGSAPERISESRGDDDIKKSGQKRGKAGEEEGGASGKPPTVNLGVEGKSNVKEILESCEPDNMSICPNCVDSMKTVTEARAQSIRMEERIRKLQGLVLKGLRILQSQMNQFYVGMDRLDESMSIRDISCLEARLTSGGSNKKSKMTKTLSGRCPVSRREQVMGLRRQIFNASKDLREYRLEMQQKISVDSNQLQQDKEKDTIPGPSQGFQVPSVNMKEIPVDQPLDGELEHETGLDFQVDMDEAAFSEIVEAECSELDTLLEPPTRTSSRRGVNHRKKTEAKPMNEDDLSDESSESDFNDCNTLKLTNKYMNGSVDQIQITSTFSTQDLVLKDLPTPSQPPVPAAPENGVKPVTLESGVPAAKSLPPLEVHPARRAATPIPPEESNDMNEIRAVPLPPSLESNKESERPPRESTMASLHGSTVIVKLEQDSSGNEVASTSRTTRIQNPSLTDLLLSPDEALRCDPQDCSKCGKTMNNKWNHFIHQSILGDRCPLLLDKMENGKITSLLFYCVFCCKDFDIRRSHLTRHIERCHCFPEVGNMQTLNDSRRQYSCVFCGQKDTTKGKISCHILKCHRELLGRPQDLDESSAEELKQLSLNLQEATLELTSGQNGLNQTEEESNLVDDAEERDEPAQEAPLVAIKVEVEGESEDEGGEEEGGEEETPEASPPSRKRKREQSSPSRKAPVPAKKAKQAQPAVRFRIAAENQSDQLELMPSSKNHGSHGVGRKKRWVCDICGRVFLRKDNYSLNRHKRTVHRYLLKKASPASKSSSPPVPTSSAPKRFLKTRTSFPSSTPVTSTSSQPKKKPKLSALQQLPSTSTSSLQKCMKCGKQFAHRRYLLSHMKILDCHLKKQVRDKPTSSCWYTCRFCGRSFSHKRKKLITHIVSTHRYESENASDLKDGYSCAFCGSQSEDEKLIQNHVLLMHCRLLGKPLTQKGKEEPHSTPLSGDMEHPVVHETGSSSSPQAETYTCGKCKRKFSSPKKLKRHQREVKCDQVKPQAESYSCPECHFNSTLKWAVIRHISTNHQPKGGDGHIYPMCIFCEERFPVLKELQKHISKTHLEKLLPIST